MPIVTVHHKSYIPHRQLQILYLGAMKLRNIIVVTLVIFLLLLSFYLGRRSAQYTYNSMTNRFELASGYASRQYDIVMFGNSIMAHGDWRAITGRCDILNLGVGGLTVADLQQQTGRVFGSRPRYCFIEVGINDITNGISYDAYISGLGHLISHISSKGIRVVSFHILYTAAAFPGSERINAQVARFNNGIDSLAGALHTDVINMNRLLAPDGVLLPEYAQNDGLHISTEGYTVWGTELNKYLAPHK